MHTQCEPGPFSSSSKGLGTRLITNCIPSQELKPRKAHRGKREREGAREGDEEGRDGEREREGGTN